MVKQTANDSIHHFSGDKADYSVFNKAWKKITGPAAENLGSVFFGSSVVIQFGTMGEGRGDKENQANREEVADSRNIVNKHSINVGFYNPAQSSLQGKGEEGVKPQTVTASKIIVKGSDGELKCIKVLRAYRIILLGETGAGKSTLGNFLFGEDVFKSGRTTEYYLHSKSAHERRITVLDTPGFSNGDLKDDIVRCSTEYTPGPHVFLIVLKMEESSEQLLAVIKKIFQSFSEEEFKYAAVVFTHVHQGMEIKNYINQQKDLQDLVKKCSGRFLVFDHNKSSEEDKIFFQSELINMIDKLVMENKGGCYTHKMIQAHKTDNKETGNPKNDKADTDASKSLWINLSGPEGNLVAKTFFGLAAEQGSPITTSLGTATGAPIGDGVGTALTEGVGAGVGAAKGAEIAKGVEAAKGAEIATGVGSATVAEKATEVGSATGADIATGVGSETGSGIGAGIATGVGPETRAEIATGVGSATGAEIATGVGSETGSGIGAATGAGIGAGIATGAGSATGAGVGAGVGTVIGSAIGAGVGAGVGTAIGSAIGAGVGSGVGTATGSAIGAGVGSAVGTATGSTIGSGVGTATGSAIGSGVCQAEMESSREGVLSGVVMSVGKLEDVECPWKTVVLLMAQFKLARAVL
ncbi:PREDICTED: fibroin heavy chain-like [Cyprinodon variegatus]|uniref:fibroin heavy chain-like n=1 Tax=Cyprinodon variegatus TaxID=28743 RepID=UPI000742BD32|nr:PREDICTED: fibroin heavy chain-like [Cyprinodon variegatus]